MKHYVRLNPNNYVMLDTYRRNHQSPIASITFFILTSLMMTVVIGAAAGVDITDSFSFPSGARQHQQR